MEEILASIRKIIESNDPGADRSFDHGLPSVYAEDEDEDDGEIRLTIEDEARTTVSIHAANDYAPAQRLQAAPAAREPAAREPAARPDFEQRPEYAQRAEPAPRAEPAQKSVSLADLAARVRATVERGDAEPQMEAPRPAPAAESPLMTSRLASLRSPMAPAQTAVEAPAPVQAPVEAEPDMQAMREVQAIRDADAAHAMEAAQAMHALQLGSEEPAPAILSETTGALVARSFDELAAAIDGQQRRSLDEIAEDMLRPMLREWLDDNLPTLVERLVREEIERVARGPRR